MVYLSMVLKERKEVFDMGSQVHQSHYQDENKEYDFDDFMVGSAVVGGLFFVIFVAFTAAQLLMK